MPISHGMQTPLPRRNYDYRIREAICDSRDPDLFPELNIPNSTIRSWLHRGIPDVVTADLVGRDHSELLAENRELHRRVALLGAIVRVFVELVRVSKTRLADRVASAPNATSCLRWKSYPGAQFRRWADRDRRTPIVWLRRHAMP